MRALVGGVAFAPGAGKTAILRHLELDRYGVVEEAATEIIAMEQAQGVTEPWSRASFIDAIVNLHCDRQLRAARLTDDLQFFDRSPICTYALAKYLGYPTSRARRRPAVILKCLYPRHRECL